MYSYNESMSKQDFPYTPVPGFTFDDNIQPAASCVDEGAAATGGAFPFPDTYPIQHYLHPGVGGTTYPNPFHRPTSVQEHGTWDLESSNPNASQLYPPNSLPLQAPAGALPNRRRRHMPEPGNNGYRCEKKKSRRREQLSAAPAPLRARAGESRPMHQIVLSRVTGLSPAGARKALEIFATSLGKKPIRQSVGGQASVLNFQALQEYVDSQSADTTSTAAGPRTRPTSFDELTQPFRGYQDVRRNKASRKKGKDCSDEKYICSFSCGWKHHIKGNFVRHEMAHFPHEIWVCSNILCSAGSRTKTTFLRKDLLRRHLKSHEADSGKSVGDKKLQECIRSVAGSLFPKECIFQGCDDTFPTLRDRSSHIAAHYERCDTSAWRNIRPVRTQISPDEVQQEDLSSETLEDSATSEAASNRSSYNGDEDPGPSGAGGGVGETTHNPSGYPPYFQSPGAHDNTSSDRWFNLPQGSNQFSSFQLKRELHALLGHQNGGKSIPPKATTSLAVDMTKIANRASDIPQEMQIGKFCPLISDGYSATFRTRHHGLITMTQRKGEIFPNQRQLQWPVHLPAVPEAVKVNIGYGSKASEESSALEPPELIESTGSETTGSATSGDEPGCGTSSYRMLLQSHRCKHGPQYTQGCYPVMLNYWLSEKRPLEAFLVTGPPQAFRRSRSIKICILAKAALTKLSGRDWEFLFDVYRLNEWHRLNEWQDPENIITPMQEHSSSGSSTRELNTRGAVQGDSMLGVWQLQQKNILGSKLDSMTGEPIIASEELRYRGYLLENRELAFTI